MSWLHVQMTLLNAAAAGVGFAVNWLLQSTLLIVAGLVVGWLLRRHGSALQSAVYRTTLAAVIVCPLATSLLAQRGISGWSVEMPAGWSYQQRNPPPGENVERSGAITLVPRPATLLPADESLPIHSLSLAGGQGTDRIALGHDQAQTLFPDMSGESASAGVMASGSVPPPAPAATPDRGMSSRTVSAETGLLRVQAFGLAAIGISLLWCLVCLVLLLRLGLAWWRLDQLRRFAVPAEASTQQACRELASLLAVDTPETLRSPYLTSPCLAGLLRPAVLLPEADVSLPIRDVLIHELAHLRRCDCFWNLARRLSEAIFFYQPLLWIVARRLESAAEEVCDDYVVQLGGDREEYARRLVDLAELASIPSGAAGVAMVSLRSILAKRVARIMDTSRSLSTRAGNLLLAVVITGGLAATTMVGFVGLGPRPSLAGTPPTAAGQRSGAADDERQADSDAVASNNNQATPDTSEQPTVQPQERSIEQPKERSKVIEPEPDNQLQGRVTGADGKPVAGAKFYWIRSRVHDIQPQRPRLVATTGDDGRYRFTPPLPGISEAEPAGWSYSDRIVITADGHGFRFTSPSELHGNPNQRKSLLRSLAEAITGDLMRSTSLPATGEPIRGRLVDINGQPVSGARVRIRWFNDENAQRSGIQEAEVRGLTNAAWQVRVGDLLGVIEPAQLRDVLPSATTDAEGRFELRNIGRKRLVQLLVVGEGIESTEIIARNEPGEKIEIVTDRHEQGRAYTVYPNEFLHVVGPSKPVAGRVLDLDTGEPIANAVVRAFMVHGERLSSSREREQFATRTDEEGRYQITGLPIGQGNRLVAFATGDRAYIPVGHVADTSAPDATLEQDFRLKRGVWAEGRVFDAETSKPFTGEITYYYFRDSRLEEAIPGLRIAYLDGRYWTNANGEFRVPVLPTRGILAFRYHGRGMDRDGIDRFPRGFGTEEIAGSEDFGGRKVFPTIPHSLMPENYERVAEVPPADGRETLRIEMPLFASQPATARALDQAGKPVTKFQVYGANERYVWQQYEGPIITVEDLRPGERRKVLIFHRGRNLAGGGFVTHGAKETIEIQLVEAGSVVGRLVDADGEPIDDASLFTQYDKLSTDDQSAIWAPHPQLSANPTTIPVDKQGRFRLEGLIPGWRYDSHASAPRLFQGAIVSIGIGQPFEDLQVEAGENKDLGDLVMGADEPDSTEVPKSEVSKSGDSQSKLAQPATKSSAVAGRVTSDDGKPARGAHVAVIGMRIQPARGGDLVPSGDVLAEGTTDENGQYRLTLAGVSSKTHRYASVIARSAAAAIAWRGIDLDAVVSDAPLTLTLEQPIRGKLIDLEGQPAAGVRLTITAVVKRSENYFAADGVGYQGETIPAAWLPAVTSDDQGRFTIRGIPAGHGVILTAEGSDRFAPQDIALDTGMPEQRGERDGTYRSLVKNAKPGEESVLPLAPAQLFEGVVRYADSGNPAPHARLTIWASQQESGGSMVSVAGKADEQGRYRISPKPGIRFGVTAYPAEGAPYLARQTPLSDAIRWEPGDRIKQLDVTLPRGVLVRGRIVEAGTETPIAAATVQYIPESSNNPNISKDLLTGWQGIQLSDKDGQFAIAVLPGPGRLLVHGSEVYVLQEIGSRQVSQGKPGGARYYAHAIEAINPQAGATTLDVKLELQPGVSVRGRIVDDRGVLVEKALVVSRLNISPHSLFWRGHATPTLSGRFELSGLAQNAEHHVYFLDAERRLGATATLKAGDGEQTVVLQPCGQAKLRVVDSNGKPVGGHYANVEMIVTPGAYRYDAVAARDGATMADADFITNIDRTNYASLMKSDEHGYVNLPALIPGASYQVVEVRNGRHQVVKEFQGQANETLDLGDVVVEAQQ